jgi:hypothetical protein
MKAKVAAAYSGRDTPGLESNVDDQLRSLIDLIRSKYISSPGEVRNFSLGRLPGLFTLDVISKVSLGDEFGCVRCDADIHGFYSTLRVHIPFMSLTIDVPWLRNFFYSDIFLKLMGPKETDTAGIGKLMGLANNVVRKRFAQDAEPKKDMLVSSAHMLQCRAFHSTCDLRARSSAMDSPRKSARSKHCSCLSPDQTPPPP